jgi:glucose-1-phosphate cytidylyltransferase
LESLARSGQLACYKHDGFWYAMDTMREKNKLESLWSSGVAPWKKW